MDALSVFSDVVRIARDGWLLPWPGISVVWLGISYGTYLQPRRYPQGKCLPRDEPTVVLVLKRIDRVANSAFGRSKFMLAQSGHVAGSQHQDHFKESSQRAANRLEATKLLAFSLMSCAWWLLSCWDFIHAKWKKSVRNHDLPQARGRPPEPERRQVAPKNEKVKKPLRRHPRRRKHWQQEWLRSRMRKAGTHED